MTEDSKKTILVDALIGAVSRAPAGLRERICKILKETPGSLAVSEVLRQLPLTYNSDLYFNVSKLLQTAQGTMSWEVLGWSVEVAAALNERLSEARQVELLWSGPSPAGNIAARRIDQVLYDLIQDAKRQIILVTFAAARIGRLVSVLKDAAARGVGIKLILEFEGESEGQLSQDALRAFSNEIAAVAEIYYWPLEQRERNQLGKPGKLHAKAAVIDDVALITSANLTDDAFNRNLELGAMVTGSDVAVALREHLLSLIRGGILQRWKPHKV